MISRDFCLLNLTNVPRFFINDLVITLILHAPSFSTMARLPNTVQSRTIRVSTGNVSITLDPDSVLFIDPFRAYLELIVGNLSVSGIQSKYYTVIFCTDHKINFNIIDFWLSTFPWKTSYIMVLNRYRLVLVAISFLALTFGWHTVVDITCFHRF